MLTGIRPDVSKLHIFRTLCYPYIEEYKRKLDARCSEGIFVGYDKSSPSYLVHHQILSKDIESLNLLKNVKT